MAKTKYIKLMVTEIELLALVDSIDSLSAISDGLVDDGSMIKDINKIDRMLKRNGYKREYL